jgi:hypothetical protein
MIKITKQGQKEFHGFCRWCGCEFTYEISDLKLSASSDKVSCPTCGKDYHHPSMVQDPTIPGGIGYQWPSDSADPCAGCAWRENLLRDGLYIGDTPCTWCNNNRFSNSITTNTVLLGTSKNPPEVYLTPCSNTSSYSSTITAHNSCCDDTEGRTSCSGEHKCSGNKNCKGKH